MSKDKRSSDSDSEKSPTMSLSLPQRPLGKDELISLGSELSVLLDSTVFNVAWDSVIQEIQDEMVVAESDQEVLSLKKELDAAGRLMAKLAAMVANAKLLSDQILREVEANYQLERELDDGT